MIAKCIIKSYVPLGLFVIDPTPRVISRLMTLRLRNGVELVLPVISVPQIAELVRAIEGDK